MGALRFDSEFAGVALGQVDAVVAVFVLHLNNDDLLQREGLGAHRRIYFLM